MTVKCVALVDFDNVFSTLWELDRDAAGRFAADPGDWLEALGERYLNEGPRRWLVARCYFNPGGWVHATGEPRDRLYFSSFRIGLVRAGFDVVDCPSISRGGKNAADIRIVMDALDLLNHRTCFEEFVIVSGDSDFTPLLQRLRAEDRRTTIVSPGFLAAAYSASADRIVDYEALRQLLKPEAVDSIVEPSVVSESEASDARDDAAEFADFVRRRYSEASGPLELAALAMDVDRAVPAARANAWMGRGSFSKALVALDLRHVRFSKHHVWDEERHQPPAGARADGDAGLPSPVALLTKGLDLPRIRREDWPRVFEVVAEYGGPRPFTLNEATRWCRDRLADRGTKVARVSIGYVIRGVQLGGLRIDTSAARTATDVGAAFLTSVLERAASATIPMDEAAERTVADWFGLGI